MKRYKLNLPEKLRGKEVSIKEYIIIQQREDGILSSGACAKILGVKKYEFQTKIMSKHGYNFSG